MNSVDDIRWIAFPTFQDERGILTCLEARKDIPFQINRIFYIYQTTENRGGHAHRETEQVAISVSGAFVFRMSDPQTTRSFRLDNPSKGLYLPPMVFLDEIIPDAPGSVCIVMASTLYDDEQYIRSFSEYLAATRQRNAD